MGNTLYHLPKPPPAKPKRSLFVTLRITQQERNALALIAKHAGVSVASLLRSYLEFGMKASAEELKGKTE